jgi:glycolate oxidase FAD binding subunit
MDTVEALAATVRELAAGGTALRPRGTGTRLDWGGPDLVPVSDVDTTGLDRIVAHNAGDFTAVLEAGVRVDEAQAVFAREGQWLALDPSPGGTIGGLFATADSGPARHRYGGPRDLIIGATVVLSDGTIASSGGTVIKNVAGYDLAKLFTGSRGTLGVIASVAVRLHPRPARTATITAETDDPDGLGRAAVALAGTPIEALSLDAWWRDGHGGLLVRFGGQAAPEQAARVAPLVTGFSTVDIVDTDDEPLWQRQRDGQRSPDGVVLKVSGRLTDLPAVIRAATGAEVVSRAGLGLSWLRFQDPEVAVKARKALAPRTCVVLDGAARLDHPPLADPALAALTERVKARFDPARAFRPGAMGGS